MNRLDAIYLFKNFRTNEKLSNRSNRSIRSRDRPIDRIDRRPPWSCHVMSWYVTLGSLMFSCDPLHCVLSFSRFRVYSSSTASICAQHLFVHQKHCHFEFKFNVFQAARPSRNLQGPPLIFPDLPRPSSGEPRTRTWRRYMCMRSSSHL